MLEIQKTESLVEAERIATRWPGRDNQIKLLVSLLGVTKLTASPNILLHGPASTGKTSVVRHIFKELKVPHVYASCAEFGKPRQLLRSIANQLKGKKRKRSEGFVGDSKAEHLAEFLAELPKAAKASAVRHIVVDHAHRLADQDTLAALLRIRELTGVQICVILVSRLAWCSGPFESDTLKATRPIEIAFPAYQPASLANILAVNPSEEILDHGIEVFKNFLRAEILPIFARSTRRLEDIQVLVDALYPIYLRPLKDGSVQDSNSSKLHFAFQPSLLAAKAAFDSGAGWRGALDTIASQGCQKEICRASSELDFELPYFSKFLLLAAYICSRNKPSMDRRVFDPSSRAGRRHGQLSHDKQVESSREAALRGPHSFPLARLLAVFWHLMRTEGGIETNADLLAGDIFMQTSSLVSLRLLSRVSADELDEAKYRCNLQESLASTISKNLSVRLSDYILYAV